MRILSSIGDPISRCNSFLLIALLLQLLHDGQIVLADRKNYASSECARVLEANPETKRAHTILNEVEDEYLLGPCNAAKWFVIELCETIQPTHIEIGNFELFSSIFKDFSVSLSDIYPATGWKSIGEFSAQDSRTLQTFDLKQEGFGKFVRVDLHSHHGSEYYCIVSEVKIYGASMVEAYEKENTLEDETAKLVEQETRTNTTSASDQINPNISFYNDPPFKQTLRNTTKYKRRVVHKTTAFNVYYNMMTERHRVFNISQGPQSKSSNSTTPLPSKTISDKPTVAPNGLRNQSSTTTQQPANRSSIQLKPSIFVELSNKYKSLEASLNQLRSQNEDMGRRLNETEFKVDKSNSFFKSNIQFVVIVVKIFFVYKLMMNLM